MKTNNLEEKVEITTGDISIIIEKDPIKFKFYAEENLITQNSFSEKNFVMYNQKKNNKLSNFKVVQSKRIEEDCLKLSVQSIESENTFVIKIKNISPGIFDVEFSNITGEIKSIKSHWQLQEEDNIYGLGERFEDLNHKNKSIELCVENGAYPGSTYKPVPFFLNTAGYGIMLETDRCCKLELGGLSSPNSYAITTREGKFHFNLIYGPELEKILERYTAMVGRPPVPEKWVFAPWKSRDWKLEDQETVFEDLYMQRELNIPCGVKLIDAGWEKEYHTFTFDEKKYPDYEKMIQTAEELGYKIVLWISPWIMSGTDAFEKYKEKDYFLKDSSGNTYVTQLGNSPTLQGGVLDFTNDEVKKWWQKNINKLMEMGIAGFKTDFGEQVPKDARFSNGLTGIDMHNIYPRIYNKLTYEIVEKYDGILLGRSGWQGSQQYPAVWAGDQSPNFCPWVGLPSAIRAGLSAGMSGFPYWGSDIGGYFGSPSPEVFARWIQFGAFSGIMQIHGMEEHDPWRFGPEIQNIYKQYAILRTRLILYIYKAACEASKTGMPLMRSLPLIYQKDKNVHKNDCTQYEYLFGENILVAPMYHSGNQRRVYLPKGSWINWWDGTKHEGQKYLKESASLHKIPLYVKEGSVIPLLEGDLDTVNTSQNFWVQDMNENSDTITYEIFSTDDMNKTAEFYGDNKIHIKSCSGEYNITLNSIKHDHVHLKFLGLKEVENVSVQGGELVEVKIVRSALAGIKKFSPDKFSGSLLKLKIPATSSNVRVKVK